MPRRILLVDDNPLSEWAPSVEANLPDVEVLRAYDASEALDLFERHKDDCIAVVLDLLMPAGTRDVLKQDLQQGKLVGQRLAEGMRKIDDEIPLLAVTNVKDENLPPACKRWFKEHSRDWDGGDGWYSLRRGEEKSLIARLSARFATSSQPTPKQTVLIVHGRDVDSRKLLTSFAEEKLGLNVLVFDELARGSISNFEHFEDMAAQADFAFVLLTPDDSGYPRLGKPERERPRARQNVILELGYLLAKMDRNSRRIAIFVGKDHVMEDLEIPSDLDGITRFEIIGDEINAELEQKVRQHIQRLAVKIPPPAAPGRSSRKTRP
jgi:predicted nucleotide-binding protein